MTLFRKVSRVTELLQREGNSVQFQDVATTLRDVMEDTSVYIVSRKGKLLGYAWPRGLRARPLTPSGSTRAACRRIWPRRC